jgi:putative two-component system response regulator
MQKKILAVDDEPNNLQVLRQILRDRYQLIFAPNGHKAVEAAINHHPDLILMDIMMPGMSGYEACETLKANSSTAAIPVIFVTAMNQIEDEARGFDAGAVDFIQKPISAAILHRRVETHLALVRTRELEKVERQSVFMLGDAGHYSDTDTGVHIWRMAAYARALAKAIGWTDEMAAQLALAAPMHDTGKIGIPHTILKAPRKLTADEWIIMKQHAEIGFQILRKSDCKLFVMAAEIALCHHEKWDGSGYPNNLAGTSIPESARIAAMADVFDALTVKRPYKEPWNVDDSVAEIYRSAGTHFEPRLVDAFQKTLPELLRIKLEWDNRDIEEMHHSMSFTNLATKTDIQIPEHS